jgi:hypothetical protein
MRFFLFLTILLGLSENAHAFGQKKMSLAEVKGVTETQLKRSADATKLSVMIRGKGAEFLFRTLQEKRTEKTGSAALELAGNVNNKHWAVNGKQVSCSRIQNGKNKKEDYACVFEIDGGGYVAAAEEAFNPSLFNLVKTKTQSKVFAGVKQKKGGRGLASAVPVAVPHVASAYAMYEPSANKRKSSDTLFVFKGKAAAEIMGFLAENRASVEFRKGGANGLRGQEISCVAGKKDGESDRCALVVSLADGAVSTSANPLFH